MSWIGESRVVRFSGREKRAYRNLWRGLIVSWISSVLSNARHCHGHLRCMYSDSLKAGGASLDAYYSGHSPSVELPLERVFDANTCHHYFVIHDSFFPVGIPYWLHSQTICVAKRETMATDENKVVVDEEETSPDEDDKNIWEQQGYSPLVSIEGVGGTMAMVSLGPNSRSPWGYPGDDDNEEDIDEEQQQVVDKNNEHANAPSDALADFREVAEQALRELELDYEQTLGKSIAAPPSTSKTPTQALEPMDFADWTDCESSSLNEKRRHDEEETPAENGTKTVPNERNDSVFSPLEDPLSPLLNQTTATKIVPEIDGDAVRRAISHMNKLQSPGFVNKFKQWESSKIPRTDESASASPEVGTEPGDAAHTAITKDELWAASFLVPQSHACIPKSILRLFTSQNQKPTTAPYGSEPSVQEETHQLSRSATMVEALCRLDALQRQERLVVHLIGCDYHEEQKPGRNSTSTPSAVTTVLTGGIPNCLQPALQWLPRARQVPKILEFHLIGPNLERNGSVEIVDSLPAPFESVQCNHHACLYHEFLQQQQEKDDMNDAVPVPPDLILSYNAGLWGYDDWKRTLEYLSSTASCKSAEEVDTRSASRKKIPFVVTAYTLLEAQEDYEVVKAIFPDSTCLWKPQLNPFGSHHPRPTATAPPQQTESYRENAAWQAWRI